MTDFLLLPTVQLKTGEQGRETEKMVSSCCIIARIQFFAIFSLASFFPSKQREPTKNLFRLFFSLLDFVGESQFSKLGG